MKLKQTILAVALLGLGLSVMACDENDKTPAKDNGHTLQMTSRHEEEGCKCGEKEQPKMKMSSPIDHSKMDMTSMDHEKKDMKESMDHEQKKMASMDHSKKADKGSMDHSNMNSMDHSKMGMSSMKLGMSDEVDFTNCRIRLNMKERPSALFVDMKNKNADEVASLVALNIKGFKSSMLHETYKNEKGMFVMKHRMSIDIPAGGELSFAEGSFHGMLMGSDGSLKTGDKVNAEFTFANKTVRAVPCEVGNIMTK